MHRGFARFCREVNCFDSLKHCMILSQGCDIWNVEQKETRWQTQIALLNQRGNNSHLLNAIEWNINTSLSVSSNREVLHLFSFARRDFMCGIEVLHFKVISNQKSNFLETLFITDGRPLGHDILNSNHCCSLFPWEMISHRVGHYRFSPDAFWLFDDQFGANGRMTCQIRHIMHHLFMRTV